jgi:hypothetical protein
MFGFSAMAMALAEDVAASPADLVVRILVTFAACPDVALPTGMTRSQLPRAKQLTVARRKPVFSIVD